jgi:hypothetical protein
MEPATVDPAVVEGAKHLKLPGGQLSKKPGHSGFSTVFDAEVVPKPWGRGILGQGLA